MRTALFNWLFARQHGGQFLLRIDDTDQQRNVEEALAPILHGFRWLGIDWDEGPEVGGPYAPYFQSQRGARYQAAVDELLARGARLPRLRHAPRRWTPSARPPSARSGRSSTAARWMAATDAEDARASRPRAARASCA